MIVQALGVLRYAPPQIGLFHRRLYFLLLIFCRRTIGCFPPCPRVLGDVTFLLVLVGSWEFICNEHIICHNDDKCHIGDQVVCPFCLGLIVFDIVNIFRDALSIKMIALHLVL